jgi:hypothetical protein
MTEIHELRDLEHVLSGEPPPEREAETLSDYDQRQINDGLFNIKSLSDMTPETERVLWVQGFGPYQRGYMRRWAQFVLYGHEKRYHKLCAENAELRAELIKIKKVVEDLADHLADREH